LELDLGSWNFLFPSVCDNAFYFRDQAPLRVIEAGDGHGVINRLLNGKLS